MAAIEIQHVTKRFGGTVALCDVSLEIAAGELHAIVGENGAGKSTLMKILSGVISEYDGEIRLHGNLVRFASTRDAEAVGVSIIHQELNLVEQLSVAANIFLGRERRTRFGWLDDSCARRESADLFRQLGCRLDPDQHVGSLRVGDQQLVEIAKALSHRASILIMDEPTSALTSAETARLFEIISRLRADGVTIIYISHKMDEVFRLADRITVLRDGRQVKTLRRDETTPREVTHLLVGREIEETSFAAPRTPGDVVLRVQHVSLPWPGHARPWRLKDISFELHRGEILGIAGLMGAGRTELLECLFGASDIPPQGRIELAGRAIAFEHPEAAVKAGLALITEDRKRLGLFSHLTVRDNISVGMLDQLRSLGLINGRRERAAAGEAIQRLGVRTAGIEAAITSLSGGNQQKCVIARWLGTDPIVLLLDDPTRGVDVGAKAEFYKLADRLCRDGLGLIVTSSELPELIMLCDRILVLCDGRLTGEFRRGEFTEQAIMEAATNRTTV